MTYFAISELHFSTQRFFWRKITRLPREMDLRLVWRAVMLALVIGALVEITKAQQDDYDEPVSGSLQKRS